MNSSILMTQTSRHIWGNWYNFFFKLRFFIPLMLNRHRIMASGYDMCFWNWTLIFLLPEMFSSHTSLMCCLAFAVFKSGWWSHFFLRFWIYVTLNYCFKYDIKCNFKIILQCKVSLLQTGHNFFPITFSSQSLFI